jgi:hypothetical protein
MPVLSPYRLGSVEILEKVLSTSLRTAFFVASGMYKVKDEDTGSNEDFSNDNFCRKYGLRATEESVSRLAVGISIYIFN